jgi:TrkA domain protein
LTRRDARREPLLYDRTDPDTTRETVELAPDEAATWSSCSGGRGSPKRLEDLRHEVEGLSIQWCSTEQGKGLAGRTIGEGRIRMVTGATVVAVIRGPDRTSSSSAVMSCS